ncbi:uncharacterized protein MAM_05364 [Metarhizium album ARSEF 1941]|uniref:Uncharacterized protein n=1 Tax=Metarhizium album (strain ARSEF 1941) TaxID=1081103 RepID=A0A0B2WS14_METAS|nr:uncharacterized protein MAM_05364 [Metarhizium album ARSEF 1941]KHN96808.1 hypothetical protein MAM_05364 [Metarhizium album ARSEF 1941]
MPATQSVPTALTPSPFPTRDGNPGTTTSRKRKHNPLAKKAREVRHFSAKNIRDISILGFQFLQMELLEPDLPSSNADVDGAVRILKSPFFYLINIKLAILHGLLEQHAIHSEESATYLYFPWKQESLRILTDGISQAKRTVVWLSIDRISRYRDRKGYIVASSISCAQRIRRDLPQLYSAQSALIPVYILAYDKSCLRLFSVDISGELLDGLKWPTVALRNNPPKVRFYMAKFTQRIRLGTLLHCLISALKGEWSFPNKSSAVASV